MEPDLHNESILRDWLTETLYPREYAQGGSFKSAAKKRIASRLHYARKTGKLKKAAKSDLDLAAFFEWACEQKGWEQLSTIPNLPRSATVAVSSPTPAQAMVGRTEALLIPTNPEQLKSELLLALARVREAQTLNKQLESSNRELEERLRVKEKKAAEGSRHGKKGLGIKKPR